MRTIAPCTEVRIINPSMNGSLAGLHKQLPNELSPIESNRSREYMMEEEANSYKLIYIVGARLAMIHAW